jgi:hypothetical protein
MRIAIMQPYFIPYAGYFRLFHAADLFVIYDCVQFIRRGWIHRNRLLGQNGELQWLTLPLKKAPQEIVIKDLEFAADANTTWLSRVASFPQVFNEHSIKHSGLQSILQISTQPLEFIVQILKSVCEHLSLSCDMVYSSALKLPDSLKAEDRIIEIVRHYGGTEYINLAGGRALYDTDHFKQHGIKLNFLSEYNGSYESILSRVIKENSVQLRQEIISQSTFN